VRLHQRKRRGRANSPSPGGRSTAAAGRRIMPVRPDRQYAELADRHRQSRTQRKRRSPRKTSRRERGGAERTVRRPEAVRLPPQAAQRGAEITNTSRAGF
jgi:hypothetical protein